MLHGKPACVVLIMPCVETVTFLHRVVERIRDTMVSLQPIRTHNQVGICSSDSPFPFLRGYKDSRTAYSRYPFAVSPPHSFSGSQGTVSAVYKTISTCSQVCEIIRCSFEHFLLSKIEASLTVFLLAEVQFCALSDFVAAKEFEAGLIMQGLNFKQHSLGFLMMVIYTVVIYPPHKAAAPLCLPVVHPNY